MNRSDFFHWHGERRFQVCSGF